MYSLVFYVPVSHVEVVKEAVFAAGGGAIGDYQACCWQVLGSGQFRPSAGATPYIGEVDTLTKVDEYRVEMVVTKAKKEACVTALKASHPYEEVAYHLVNIVL